MCHLLLFFSILLLLKCQLLFRKSNKWYQSIVRLSIGRFLRCLLSQSSTLRSLMARLFSSFGEYRWRLFLHKMGWRKLCLVKQTNKLETMSNEQWDKMDEKALSIIHLCLSKEILCEVVNETTTIALWLKLESLYMTKSLANKLRFKKWLYTIHMVEGTPI